MRAPTDPRRLALEALRRIDDDGSYANLLVPSLLARSGLETRDRGLVTELVYGSTRMRRTCDFLVERFLRRPPPAEVMRVLRLGAYQLAFLRTPPHAAVATTVSLAPDRFRGLVNAVLRKVATEVAGGLAGVSWPSDAVRLSYPDWVVQLLVDDLGAADAEAALVAMNERASVTERPDGYVQDPASQWVARLVGAEAGRRVADVCAAPGGKATALASSGAWVVASDVRVRRAGLVTANRDRLGLTREQLAVVVADATRLPYRPGSFDRVLLDAPCSGLGALRRRPDARWRVDPADVEALAALQRRLVDAAVDLLAPGGRLIYSVCTVTAAETLGVDEHLARRWPDLRVVALDVAIDAVVEAEVAMAPGDGGAGASLVGRVAGRPWGRGRLLLPHDAGTDGMFGLVVERPA